MLLYSDKYQSKYMGKFDKMWGVFDKQKMWVAFMINLSIIQIFCGKEKEEK